MKQLDLFEHENPMTVAAIKVGAARMQSGVPVGHRVAIYPNGDMKIQGAYPWQEGLMSGVVWLDLPVVRVNEFGEEVARV